ncbi:hypothetical protein [Pseudooceanicola algae]|uniref:Uncharacterized protein n=1 Tax=Pseudooceanicola algae TaxID=1537215 RepID=A0A418SGB9_9RHOB|nr:hypothetical protein [Pseudooceanicola algae]QPM91695.1 hypothetical protein PSAL_029500 [Pseudooceanicola algae]
MTHTRRHALALILLLLATPAWGQGACYADYKARRDAPYALHYGVVALSSCAPAAAEAELRAKLSAAGWTLLNLVSIFGADGLEQRKANAGQYFLRF